VLLNRLAGLIALQNGCFLPGAIERRDALNVILRTRKLLCVSSPPVKVVSFEDLFGTCAKTAISCVKERMLSVRECKLAAREEACTRLTLRCCKGCWNRCELRVSYV
jgi:hypothetical protein